MSRLAKLAGGRAAALVVLLFQVGAPAVLGQTGSTGAGRVVFRPVPSVDTDQGVSAPEIVISPGLLGIELSVSDLGSEVKSVRPSIKVASGQWIRLAGRLTEADGASWSLGAELPYEPGMRVEVAVQVTSEGGEASRFTETQIWDGTQFVSASSFDWASISPEVAAFWDRLVGYFDFPEIGVPLQLSSVSSQSTVKFDPQAPSTEGGGHRFCFDLGEKANFILNIPGGLVYYDASPQPSDSHGGDLDWGDEFGRNYDPHPASHVVAFIEDAESLEPLWGPWFLSEDGCTEELQGLTSDRANIAFGYWSRRSQDGAQMATFNCDAEGCEWPIVVVLDRNIPDAPSTITVYQGSSSNTLAAIHWAGFFTLQRWLPIHPGSAFVLLKQPIGGPAASNLASGLPTAHFPGESGRRKFTVAHEVAHLISAFRLMPDLDPKELDYLYAGNVSHGMDTREWQPVAAFEGLANFASVHTWFSHDASEPLFVQRSDPNADPVDARTWDISEPWLWFKLHSGDCEVTDMGVRCPPGVGVELDWTATLWAFHQTHDESDESHRGLMALLPHTRPALVFPELYFNQFELAIEAEFGATAAGTFDYLSEAYGIDN